MEETYAAFPNATFSAVVRKTADGASRDILAPLILSNSEWEIGRLAKAQRAANAATAALRKAALGGATIREAGVEARVAAIRSGVDEIDISGSVIAEPWTFASYDWAPEGLRFEPGKLYTIEIGYSMVDGLCVQTCRMFSLGEPEPEVRRMHEVGLKSMQAMLDVLKVGVTGSELWDAGLAPLTAAGYAPWCRLGHACGVELMGPQGLQFFPGDNNPVAPHQAVQVHGAIVSADGVKVGIIGDTVIAGEGGWRYLTNDPAPFDLQ
jgi:Xaa-Pro aminopeptidase